MRQAPVSYRTSIPGFYMWEIFKSDLDWYLQWVAKSGRPHPEKPDVRPDAV